MIILELDIGNSRIKWRATDTTKGAAVKVGEAAGLQELKTNLSEVKPDAVRLCSVRGKTFTSSVCQWFKDSWGIEALEAKVERSSGGVTNNYEDLSQLGIDRWLAMLAAYQLAGSTCVIRDSGTA